MDQIDYILFFNIVKALWFNIVTTKTVQTPMILMASSADSDTNV